MRDWLDRTFAAHRLAEPAARIEANSIVMLPRLIEETSLLTLTSTRNLAEGRLGAKTTHQPHRQGQPPWQ